MSSSILPFQADLAGRSISGYVVHPGSIRLPPGPSVTALPFSDQKLGTVPHFACRIAVPDQMPSAK